MWVYLEILILLAMVTLVVTQVIVPLVMDTKTWWLFRKESPLKELDQAAHDLEKAKLEKETREIKKETRKTDDESRPTLWD